jgi:hypothetical protein
MDDSNSSRPQPPLDACDAPEPAEGFADRVMARFDSEVRRDPSRSEQPPVVRQPWAMRPWMAALLGAAVASAILLAVFTLAGTHTSEPTIAGQAMTGAHRRSATRSTEILGGRGVAVLEAGAALSWQIDGDGHGLVTQQGGSVFYRIENATGQRFAVMTAQGRVDVTGTCFTIAIADGKSAVRVHEGAVALRSQSDRVELLAGQGAWLTGLGIELMPAEASEISSAPAAAPEVASTASMAQPIARTRPEANQPKLVPDAATLAQWAKTCHVRADMPPFEEQKPKSDEEWDAYTRSMGGTAAETEAVRDAFAAVEQHALARLREVYVQATGDRTGAANIPLEQMIYEIGRTGEYQEEFEVYQRISAERAGLQPPPSPDQFTPLELLLREILRQGDAFEVELAKQVGAARARQLRERNQGWPGEASEWEGCPKR